MFRFEPQSLTEAAGKIIQNIIFNVIYGIIGAYSKDLFFIKFFRPPPLCSLSRVILNRNNFPSRQIVFRRLHVFFSNLPSRCHFPSLLNEIFTHACRRLIQQKCLRCKIVCVCSVFTLPDTPLLEIQF